ncbi:Uma2 family endonuclease, partial [Klebsiella pneumoniae]|uniref:Uma2 family endonuclease n=1 Tax=Klebsiella pneumoniae TaxID=573 RepID=UPI0034E94CBB
VVCGQDDEHTHFTRRPCLVVEVLSSSTEGFDRGEKFYHYRRLPSLQTYVLVHADKVRVEVFRRGPGAAWTLELFEGDGAAFALPCPEVTLSLAEL